MHSVLETSAFARRADDLLSRVERDELVDTLARDPLAGDVIPGLGGVRKLRFAARGRGKSGGFRVIYYVLHDNLPILALLLYGKNEQDDLSALQRQAVVSVVEKLRRA